MFVVNPDSYRDVKSKKAEFTCVNEHFLDERNADNGHYGQTLITAFSGIMNANDPAF